MRMFLLLWVYISSVTIIFPQENGMVLIEAGEFVMGSDIKHGANFYPAHKVKVDSFYMDTCEVTNAQYMRFCKETGHGLPEFWNTPIFKSGEAYPDYPVIGVNYWDAKKYAEWAGKRLPTEAEWEYAARGGLVGKDFPLGDEFSGKKEFNVADSGWKNLIYPVGTLKPNAYGLYDMSGNVWEWVADRYSYKYYAESSYSNPQGPDVGDNRVIRGGSWRSGNVIKLV